MRRIVILSYTEKGRQLNSRVSEYLEKMGDVAVSFFYGNREKNEVMSTESNYDMLGKGIMSTSEILQQEWNCSSAFVFIGALGIAVRHVAPFLQNKCSDPAVLVLDEKGQFVIPVVSGHIGGGVRLAWEVAQYLGAQAVITTATDVENQFAVDVFAQRNHLWIENPGRIKGVSSALLHGRMVDVWTSLPIAGDIPEGLCVVPVEEEIIKDLQVLSSENEIPDVLSRQEIGIGEKTSQQDRMELRDRGTLCTAITIGLTSGEVEQIYRIYDAARVCELYPRYYILGIGCKKGKTVEELEGFLQEICKKLQIDIHEIGAVTSIDVKREEKGIWELSRRIGADFEVFTKQELEQVEEKVTPSDFVKETVGVDNVCERSAYCLARRWAQGQRAAEGTRHTEENRTAEESRKNGEYRLVLEKQARDGMTMALVKTVPRISWPQKQ